LKPILPQFAEACAEFVRMAGSPRPFAALDWCQRCGQPDWAHQAGGADRMCRIASMNPEDMSYALAYLAEYSPGAFDDILDAIGPTGRVPDSDADEEPYCASCGATLAIFMDDGPCYRHYRDTDDGDAQRYSVDHPTTIGWRQARDHSKF
jgi:hypothetical protein